MTKRKTPRPRETKKPAPSERAETIQRVYVAYPESFMVPADGARNLPNTYVVGTDPKFVMLEVPSHAFEETNNPFEALHALTAAHRIGVYPSIEVLDFLSRAIDVYFEGHGKKRFDQCLGIVGGTGISDYFGGKDRASKVFLVCFDVLVWQKVFGQGLIPALDVTARQFGYKFSTAQKYYSRGKWKSDKLEALELFKVLEARINQWNEQDKKNFVSKYHYEFLVRAGMDIPIRSLHKDYPR